MTLARRPLPGDPRDPGAADRGGARGLHAAEVALLALRTVRRARRSSSLARRRARLLDVQGRARARRPRLLSIAGGVLSLFIGVAMISSRLVKPLAAFVGWPVAAHRRRRPAELASGNAQRNPGRTARDRGGADDRNRPRHLRGGARERDEGLEPRGDRGPGQRRLRHHRAGRLHAVRRGRGRRCRRVAETPRSLRTSARTWARSATRRPYVTGIEPRTIAADVHLRLEGRLRQRRAREPRRGTAPIVDTKFAEDNNIAVGDTITVLTPSGDDASTRPCAGIYEPPPFYPLLGERRRLEGDVRLATTTARGTSSRS